MFPLAIHFTYGDIYAFSSSPGLPLPQGEALSITLQPRPSPFLDWAAITFVHWPAPTTGFLGVRKPNASRGAVGNIFQYSCLENPMDGGAWWAAVHGVAKSRTRQGAFTFTFHFHALEKEMTTHSSVLAWRIPGTGEPGGLPSLGSHRVGLSSSGTEN